MSADDLVTVTYDTALGSYRCQFDADLPHSTGVALCVASIEGVAADQLPPLAEALDPDALDALIGSSGLQLRVGFNYAGYEVVIPRAGEALITA